MFVYSLVLLVVDRDIHAKAHSESCGLFLYIQNFYLLIERADVQLIIISRADTTRKCIKKKTGTNCLLLLFNQVEMVSFIELKRINACIHHLEKELADISSEELAGFTKAIDLLKEYRNEAQDYYEEQYYEHMYCSDDDESKFCF